MSNPKPPASAPLIAQKTTLEQDKATVLAVFRAMCGKEDTTRRHFHGGSQWAWRDESSDDVSEWWGARVATDSDSDSEDSSDEYSDDSDDNPEE